MPSTSTPPPSPTPGKTQRLLDLLAFLISHRFPVSRGQIWDHVVAYRQKLDQGTDEASVRRMFERDKKELLEMDFPLETVEVPGNDPEDQILYRLRAQDFHLPYLRLIRREMEPEDDEGAESAAGTGAGSDDLPGQRPKDPSTPLAAIDPDTAFRVAEPLAMLRSNPALPFRDEAQSAFRKLTFDLTGDPDDLFGAAPVIVPGDDEDTRDRIPELARAIRARRVLRFSYRGIERDAPTRREVEPWSLLYRQNRWYLIGHDRTRDARRTFRVSRILELDPVPPGPVRDLPPEFERPRQDLSEWNDAEAWDLPGMDEPATEVLVRFRFPRSLWADRNRAGELVEWDDDGSALRRFGVRSREPFLRWILGQMDDVEIVEPPEYARELDAMRHRVIEANPTLFRQDPEGSA